MVNTEIFVEGKISLPYREITENDLKKLTENIAQNLDLENVSITLILTDNDFIHGINRDYRKKDQPTDVISFAYRENPFPDIEEETEQLGDIYISLEKAVEQAKEYEVTFSDEIKRLLIHGILHLIGYDHETSEDDAEKMRDMEEKLFESVK